MASVYPTTKTKGFLYIPKVFPQIKGHQQYVLLLSKNPLEQLVGSKKIYFRGILDGYHLGRPLLVKPEEKKTRNQSVKSQGNSFPFFPKEGVRKHLSHKWFNSWNNNNNRQEKK